MIVYLLYAETGEYSDYAFGNKGIFSTVEKAKQWLEQDCIQVMKTILMNYTSTYDYRKRTSWEVGENGDWHSSLVSERADRCDWTIAPFTIDEP